MNYYRYIRLIGTIYLLSVLIFLVNCGGGSSSGKDVNVENTPSSPYTGVTIPVKIDENNAQQLSNEVYGVGGSFGSDLSMMGAISLKSHNYLSPIIDISQAVIQSFHGFVITPDSESVPSASAETYNNTDVQTIEDGFGGILTRTININEMTYEVTGNLVFNHYHPDETTVFMGTITFSGLYDKNTGKLSLNCTFDDYREINGSCSITLIGTASVEIADSNLSMTLDMFVKDDNSEKVYWFEDTSLTMTDTTSSTEVNIQGRYYNPDYGYVDFITPETFIFIADDEYPTEGLLALTGSEGTKAHLEVFESGYQIEADTDGDGNFDWQSGPLSWQ